MQLDFLPRRKPKPLDVLPDACSRPDVEMVTPSEEPFRLADKPLRFLEVNVRGQEDAVHHRVPTDRDHPAATRPVKSDDALLARVAEEG
jgi:hypothetical protein